MFDLLLPIRCTRPLLQLVLDLFSSRSGVVSDAVGAASAFEKRNEVVLHDARRDVHEIEQRVLDDIEQRHFGENGHAMDTRCGARVRLTASMMCGILFSSSALLNSAVVVTALRSGASLWWPVRWIGAFRIIHWKERTILPKHLTTHHPILVTTNESLHTAHVRACAWACVRACVTNTKMCVCEEWCICERTREQHHSQDT